MAGRDCHGTWKYWPASGPVFMGAVVTDGNVLCALQSGVDSLVSRAIGSVWEFP